MHHRCTDGSVSSDERLFVSPPLAWPGRICVLALCSLLFMFSPSRAVADFSGLVVSVLDGDTIEVLHNNRAERIRLSGIDCPEKGQAYGTRAKQAASELVLGGEVTLQTYGHDKYGRTIWDSILPDGMNYNTPPCEAPMPYRRFPGPCDVTYNAGPFLTLPLAHCSDFRASS